MTFEELKAEANRQGYALLKRTKREKFEKCVCGHNRKRMVCKNGLVAYYCMNCNFTSPFGKDELDARAKWNEAIRSMGNE